MSVSEALTALLDKQQAALLSRVDKSASAAREVARKEWNKVEQAMKPHMVTIKRYVSRRLKAAKLSPRFEHRGWCVNYRGEGKREHMLYLSVRVHVGRDVWIETHIRGNTVAELDARIDAITAAATAMQEKAPQNQLKIVS